MLGFRNLPIQKKTKTKQTNNNKNRFPIKNWKYHIHLETIPQYHTIVLLDKNIHKKR